MKKIILLLVLSLFFFHCGNDDNEVRVCTIVYTVITSDDCDCLEEDSNCWNRVTVGEDEYLRLLDIIENSTKPCIYIQFESFFFETVEEGYLISIGEGERDGECWDIDFDF